MIERAIRAERDRIADAISFASQEYAGTAACRVLNVIADAVRAKAKEG